MKWVESVVLFLLMIGGAITAINTGNLKLRVEQLEEVRAAQTELLITNSKLGTALTERIIALEAAQKLQEKDAAARTILDTQRVRCLVSILGHSWKSQNTDEENHRYVENCFRQKGVLWAPIPE